MGKWNCVCSAGLFLGSSGTVSRAALASLSRGLLRAAKAPLPRQQGSLVPWPFCICGCCCCLCQRWPWTDVMGNILVSSMTLQEVTFPRRCAILMSLRLETWTQTKGKHPTMRLSLPVNWELETSLMFSLWAWQCVMFTPIFPQGDCPFPLRPQSLLLLVFEAFCVSLSLFFWCGLSCTCYLDFLDNCWVFLTWKG